MDIETLKNILPYVAPILGAIGGGLSALYVARNRAAEIKSGAASTAREEIRKSSEELHTATHDHIETLNAHIERLDLRSDEIYKHWIECEKDRAKMWNKIRRIEQDVQAATQTSNSTTTNETHNS